MWKTFYINNEVFLIKHVIDSDLLHKLYLTDLQNIWLEELSNECAGQRFQTLNPLCVDANIVEELTTLIKHSSNETVSITRNAANLKLEINIAIDEFPLKFYWDLNVQPQDEVFKVFTLSLINTIQYLELEQHRLHELLEKKDKEIDEYKREYGEISRDLLKTQKFVRKDGTDCDTNELLLDLLTNKDIFPHLMDKYGTDALKNKSKSMEKVEPKRRKLKPYKSKFAK